MRAGSVEPGRAGKHAETVALAAFSLRVLQRSAAKVWSLVALECRGLLLELQDLGLPVMPARSAEASRQVSPKRARRGCGLSSTGTGVARQKLGRGA